LIQIPSGVLIAGNLTQDILVWPVDDVVFNRTTWVDDIAVSIGGNGANTAYAIARLGGRVRLAGTIGDDEAGRTVTGQLKDAGVDIAAVRFHSLPTPLTVVIVRSDAARAFLHRPGASREAFPEALEFTAELTAGCSHFHLANPFAMPLMRPQAGDTIERARRAGLTTSLDTGWDALGQWLKVIGPCLAHLDLLFVNEEESEKLTGEADPSCGARFFHARGVGAVVVKRGAKGCLVSEGGAQTLVPGYAIHAVDTTGAGDCFAGAFLAALQRGLDGSASARLANAAGALSALRPGAIAGLLDYSGTVDWMNSREGSATPAPAT
jgi:sugar/nucleoside kinase (ribokinase family)